MGKQYNLEERTLQFARDVALFVEKIPKSIANFEYSKQVVRSSGSVGANYIEANEALSKRDFLMRIKISKKECKESRYWLRLIDCANGMIQEQGSLINESTELMKIFGAILVKSQ